MSTGKAEATPGQPRIAQLIKKGRGWVVVRNSATLADTDYEHIGREIVDALNAESELSALKSREAVLVRLIRRYAAECVECNGTGRKFMYVSEITDDDVYDDCSQCADIRAALAQVPK
jgi:hypothetical protein